MKKQVGERNKKVEMKIKSKKMNNNKEKEDEY